MLHIDPERILTKVARGADYADIRLQGLKEVEVAVRTDSVDMFQRSEQRATCRVAAAGGYGIATTNTLDSQSIEQLAEEALKHAKTLATGVTLQSLSAQVGEVKHRERKEFDTGQALDFLKHIHDKLRERLGGSLQRSELIASHYHTDSTLVTSEGTNIHEKTPITDVTIYAITKDANQGFASRILGNKGGLEVLDEQPWEAIFGTLATRARDSTRAETLPGSLTMKRHKVVLDSEAAGALAHEFAHLLEADVHQKVLFQGLRLPRDFKVIDDPTLENGYGSFCWDDEGVKSSRKTLLSLQDIGLLHTRITAVEGVEPGNAHGVTHMPRPMASNVYIKASDWRFNEMLEDARTGIYAEGIVRAETDTANGRIELQPEIAYIFEKKELRNPVRNLRIICSVKDAEKIGAIGRDISFRPTVEKGFCISEGAPAMRIDGVLCL